MFEMSLCLTRTPFARDALRELLVLYTLWFNLYYMFITIQGGAKVTWHLSSVKRLLRHSVYCAIFMLYVGSEVLTMVKVLDVAFCAGIPCSLVVS